MRLTSYVVIMKRKVRLAFLRDCRQPTPDIAIAIYITIFKKQMRSPKSPHPVQH